jgi:hypothetical protein
VTYLESRLRDSLRAQVADPPTRPGLPEEVVRRGRRVRRRRRAVLPAGALAVGLVAAGLVAGGERGRDAELLGPALPGGAATARAYLDGLPGAELSNLTYVDGELLEYRDERGSVGGGTAGAPVTSAAMTAGGAVLVTARGLVGYEHATFAFSVLDDRAVSGPVVVTPAGAAAYAVQDDGGWRLVRRDLAGGGVDETVVGGPRTVVAAVGDEVLLDADGGVEAWSPASREVREVGPGRYTAALAGHPGGLVALTLASGCHEVSRLVERPGLWETCDDRPLVFSPGGGLLLASSGSELRVLDALSGEVVRSVDVPLAAVASWAWESDLAVLLLVRRDPGEVVPVRCRVGGGCERAGMPRSVTSRQVLVGATPSRG